MRDGAINVSSRARAIMVCGPHGLRDASVTICRQAVLAPIVTLFSDGRAVERVAMLTLGETRRWLLIRLPPGI